MSISEAKAADNTRRRLPNRRACRTLSFSHAGADFTASIGRYPDGRIGERNSQGEPSSPIGHALDLVAVQS